MHDFYNSLFTYNDYLAVRNDIVTTLQWKKEKLTAEQLSNCFTALRKLMEHRPLVYCDLIEFFVDTLTQADTSIMNERERKRLSDVLSFIPERFLSDAKTCYNHIAIVNDDHEVKHAPSHYRLYKTSADFEAALQPAPDGDICDLSLRLEIMQIMLRHDYNEFIDYAAMHIKYSKNKPVIDAKTLEDAKYDFKDEYMLSLLASICRYQKATTNEEKIDRYIEIFGHLKNVVNFMHDFGCKVYGPEHFPRLPIMDMEAVKPTDPKATAPSIKM